MQRSTAIALTWLCFRDRHGRIGLGSESPRFLLLMCLDQRDLVVAAAAVVRMVRVEAPGALCPGPVLARGRWQRMRR